MTSRAPLVACLAASLTLALAALAACEAVPDVVYVGDDAGDAGGDSATIPDGANTCPGLVPPYATACCGAIPCSGANCAATCADCARCSLLDLCCPNAQNRAVCRPSLRCN